MEMSLYLGFVGILMHHLSVRQALGISFLTGVAVCLLPIRKIKHHLIDRVPHRFSNAVALTMAVFLLTVACGLMGLIDFHKGYLTFTGRSDNSVALIGLGGVLGIVFFEILGVKPSVLITVVIIAALSKAPLGPSSATNNHLISLSRPDFTSWYGNLRAWEAVFVLFVLSCYGSLAKVINLARSTTIEDAHGALPGLRKIFFLDGVTTVFGSVLGSTNFTTFIESGVGIAAGGRTGLAAVVAAILMFSGFILRPFIDYVPLTAAVGALVYVGFLFIPKGDSLTAFRRFEFLVVALMLGITICTLSLGAAFAVGLLGFWAGSYRSKSHDGKAAHL
jgi:adenine/guanine/hypoxanthine permease